MSISKNIKSFLKLSETLYVVIVACGIGKALGSLPDDEILNLFTDYYVYLLGIGTIFLVLRFFYAPVLNLRLRVEQEVNSGEKGRLWTVLVADFPLLLIHSYIIFRMCSFLYEQPLLYFKCFSALLIANSLWLWIIRRALRPGPKYIETWIWNNMVHFGLITIICFLSPKYSLLLLFLLFTNSFIDILFTHKTYLPLR